MQIIIFINSTIIWQKGDIGVILTALSLFPISCLSQAGSASVLGSAVASLRLVGVLIHPVTSLKVGSQNARFSCDSSQSDDDNLEHVKGVDHVSNKDDRGSCKVKMPVGESEILRIEAAI